MRGHHGAVRTADLATAKEFYVGKLDFRVIAEWPYADEQLAYLAPPTDDHFYIEVLGGGAATPTEVRPYTDLGDSLKYRGYHHFCLNVRNVEETVKLLRSRACQSSPSHSYCRHQPQAPRSLPTRSVI
jgi:lactoylglutathione lyase/glyoxylase I family protein